MQALLGGPEVTGSIPSQGTKITHEVRRGQKKKNATLRPTGHIQGLKNQGQGFSWWTSG